MTKPTPTQHGAWRVIDGQLVNEDDAPKPIVQSDTPLIGSTDVRVGGPDIPVPPADEPNHALATTGRKASKSKE